MQAIPLSSDAYCSLEVDSENCKQDVDKAFQQLLTKIIPDFAQKLASYPCNGHNLNQLPALLHQEGINMRYSTLGIIECVCW